MSFSWNWGGPTSHDRVLPQVCQAVGDPELFFKSLLISTDYWHLCKDSGRDKCIKCHDQIPGGIPLL